MNDLDLHRLLTAAAEDVRPTQPPAAGWDRARRVRRARRAAGAAAVTVALLAGGTALALRPADPPAPTAPASPAPSASPVQRPPAELSYPGHPLGRLGDPVVAKLSARPVHQALALFQPVDPSTGASGRIRVLGDDGLVRDLDVVTPAPTRDAEGNEAVPLKTGSLSPDGRNAAFAQTDQVIVVDLTTAAVRRFPLKGYLEHALWSGDRLFVGDDDTTYELDRSTGGSRKLPVSPWDLVVPDPNAGSGDLLTLTGIRESLTVNRVADDGERLDRQRVGTGDLPFGYRVDEWYGRGWQRGDRIARAGWITRGNVQGDEGVAVLDARTGAVTHLLDVHMDRWKACCEVLGWDRSGAVLLRQQPGGLLRWRPETGEVTGVTRNVFGAISLATGLA